MWENCHDYDEKAEQIINKHIADLTHRLGASQEAYRLLEFEIAGKNNELKTVKQKSEDLYKGLLKLEWCNTERVLATCPVCGGLMPHSTYIANGKVNPLAIGGHKEGCWLKQLLESQR